MLFPLLLEKMKTCKVGNSKGNLTFCIKNENSIFQRS